MGLFGSSSMSKSSSSSSPSTASHERNSSSQPSKFPFAALPSVRGPQGRGSILKSYDLMPDSLFVLLFSRGNNRTNEFHWALYDHVDEGGGTKYHIRGMGSNWIADHGFTAGVTKSFLLIGLIRLADIDVRRRADLHRIIRSEDVILNQIAGQTCRVWVMRACERLKAAGFLAFPGWPALQEEMFAFGNMNCAAADENIQPRPVVDSRYCCALTR